PALGYEPLGQRNEPGSGHRVAAVRDGIAGRRKLERLCVEPVDPWFRQDLAAVAPDRDRPAAGDASCDSGGKDGCRKAVRSPNLLESLPGGPDPEQWAAVPDVLGGNRSAEHGHRTLLRPANWEGRLQGLSEVSPLEVLQDTGLPSGIRAC